MTLKKIELSPKLVATLFTEYFEISDHVMKVENVYYNDETDKFVLFINTDFDGKLELHNTVISKYELQRFEDV